MATIQRPVKEGSVRTYQEKVGLGFVDILASEMDADLDTIYAAWNGGVDSVTLNNLSVTTPKIVDGAVTTPKINDGAVTTPKIVDGAVTYAKLAPDAQLWTDTGTALTPGTNFANRSMTVAGSLTCNTTNAATGGQATLIAHGTTGVRLATNDRWAPPTPSRASWNLELDTAVDAQLLHRAASAGSGTSDQFFLFSRGGDFQISGANGYKATGTTWANPSDRRMKNEIEDYPTGLAAIVALQPRMFVYNGQGGSTVGMRGYGFIADEVAPVMPEMVGSYRYLRDGAADSGTDYGTVDQSNLILALVNAVRELAARVTALEVPA
jgi:hypothetical protein